MKLNKALVFFIAIATVFCFAGTALAANRVEVKVTSEPIGYHARCDKAGGWSLELDTATVLTDGDIITIDMPVNPATGEQVTLCQSFDIEISPSGAGSFWTGAVAMLGNIPAADCPFVDEQQTSRLVGESSGIMFRVTGTAGENRVTLSIIGDDPGDALEVGPFLEDNLILYFLDQKLNDNPWGNYGVWQYGTAIPATLADNTLCINVEQWDQPVVLANMDSKDDKYTFIPSNPQIAHIITSAYEVFDCKAKAAGHIPVGSRTDPEQADPTANCQGFDNESGSVYCSTPPHVRNYFIVEKTMGTWDLADYTIEMELLVNDASDDNGFYFTDDAVYTESASSISDPALSGLCAYSNKSGDIVGTQSAYTYNGTTDPVAADSNVCDVATANRSVWLETDESDLGLSYGDKFLLVDIPMIHYDLETVALEDVVSVKITIKKAPCGVVFEETIVIGTYGCPTTPPAEQIACLTFPYFTATAIGSDEWWDGIVITNLGSNDGTAKIKIYELDGDQGYTEVSVGALSQYVGLLSSLSFTKTGGTGTIGDSRSFIVVCFTGSDSIDGFAMMGDGTQAQGYLPRNCGCSNCSGLCP